MIANAGILSVWPTIKELDVEDLKEHMEVNVYGVVWLFQAALPLLRKAIQMNREPKWVTVGSMAGWTEVCFPPSSCLSFWRFNFRGDEIIFELS